MKDSTGAKTIFAIWGKKNNEYAKIGDVLQFTNMKVDKYPKSPPHYLRTTDATKIRVLKDKQTMNVFNQVHDYDGTLEDYTVDIVHDVKCYASCPHCSKGTDEESKTCSKCKSLLDTLVEDFRFDMYLKKNGVYVDVRGFRKSLGDLKSLILKDLDATDSEDVEDKLNSVFGGKIVTIGYNIKDGEEQKTIQEIHLAVKPDVKNEDEEPLKKKPKYESQKISKVSK